MSSFEFGLRTHDRLERLLQFELRLITRTGLHIGAGKSAALAGSDLPVMRDADGWPLIPGSSLRGRLRAAIASLVDALGLEKARPTAQPKSESLVSQWEHWSFVERLFGRVPKSKDDGRAYGSRLQFSDLLCERSKDPNVIEATPIELRDGVGISRETRTASTGVKYDLEVVPAGTSFSGKVRFLNPADYETGLVAQALWMLDQGMLLLGGKSARGLGWVEVQVTPPTLWSAIDLLDGTAQKVEASFGSVADHFSQSLDSLRDLAQAAGVKGAA